MLTPEIEARLRKRQKNLLALLTEEYYTIPALMLLIGIKRSQLEIMLSRLKEYPGKGYKRMDIILKLSGGKLFENEGIKH